MQSPPALVIGDGLKAAVGSGDEATAAIEAAWGAASLAHAGILRLLQPSRFGKLHARVCVSRDATSASS